LTGVNRFSMEFSYSSEEWAGYTRNGIV
jgi:hypothetical protein